MRKYFATEEQRLEDLGTNAKRTHPPISQVQVVKPEEKASPAGFIKRLEDIESGKVEAVSLDDIVGPKQQEPVVAEYPLPPLGDKAKPKRTKAERSDAAKAGAARRKANKASYPHNDQGGA